MDVTDRILGMTRGTGELTYLVKWKGEGAAVLPLRGGELTFLVKWKGEGTAVLTLRGEGGSIPT